MSLEKVQLFKDPNSDKCTLWICSGGSGSIRMLITSLNVDHRNAVISGMWRDTMWTNRPIATYRRREWCLQVHPALQSVSHRLLYVMLFWPAKSMSGGDGEKGTRPGVSPQKCQQFVRSCAREQPGYKALICNSRSPGRVQMCRRNEVKNTQIWGQGNFLKQRLYESVNNFTQEFFCTPVSLAALCLQKGTYLILRDQTMYVFDGTFSTTYSGCQQIWSQIRGNGNEMICSSIISSF